MAPLKLILPLALILVAGPAIAQVTGGNPGSTRFASPYRLICPPAIKRSKLTSGQ